MPPRKLSDILARLLKTHPVLEKRVTESQAFSAWETAVGPAICKHSKVLRVFENRLWVEIDHPIWKTEIHLRKRQIVDRLNEVAGSEIIEDLYLVDPKGRG